MGKKKKGHEQSGDKEQQFASLLRQAKRTCDLSAIFSIFQCFEDVSKKKKSSASKRKKSPQEIDFLAHVDPVLKLILAYQRNHKREHWPQLFYEYMVEQTNQENFTYFLSYAQTKHVIRILEYYCIVIQPIEPDHLLGQTMLNAASSLLSFLVHYELDPFSCLIGLTIPKNVIEKANQDSEGTLFDVDCGQTREELLQKVMEWAIIDNSDLLQKEVREFAGQLRGVKGLKSGSLVLVGREKEKFCYARYLGIHKGSNINVYLHPKDTKPTCVPLDSVFPLQPSLITKIRRGNIKEMEKLVTLPTDALYQDLMRVVEKRTHSYFKENGIDMAVIRKTNNNQCSISELQELKVAQTMLEELCSNPPLILFTDLDSVLSERIKEFGEREKPSTAVFLPTHAQNLRQLETFQVRALVMMHAHRYVGICESGLDQLQLQKRELMSGERKDKISAWWLAKIDTDVLAYLETLGYSYDAVPENYVEEEPADLSIIHKNVDILSPLLNAEEENEGIKNLIATLQEEIYPKIQSFIADAKIVLSEQFDLKLGSNEDFSLEKVEEAFARSENIDDQVRGWIDDMIKDIRYLREMQLMEDPEYAKTHDVSAHIVPISGLIIGMLCRLENECKTVCEIWEAVEEPDDWETKSPLHEAIVNKDIDQVEEILKATPDEINKPDANGFTAILMAASNYSVNHIRIVDRLLEYENIDINKKTGRGENLLHILSRYPGTSEEDVLQMLLSTVNVLIEKGINVNGKNISGETCLHAACKFNNSGIVRLLLNAGALVTEPNFDGESCSFTAVRFGSLSALEVLIDFGVDLNQMVEGKTLLDIATQLQNEDAVKLLSGETVDVPAKKTVSRRSRPDKSSYFDQPSTHISRVSMKFTLSDLNSLGEVKKTKKPLISSHSVKDWTSITKAVMPTKKQTKISLGRTRRDTTNQPVPTDHQTETPPQILSSSFR